MKRTLLGLKTGLTLTLVAGLMAFQEARAQDQEKEEYVTSAPSTALLQEDLAAFDGKEANIRTIELPPGWIGGRHYHTSDVFVYVLEGDFAVDVEGEDRKTFTAGEIYHEALNKVMQASNPSTTEAAKILVFQVGDKGEPLMIKAD